jgi:hypothetical protein
VNRKDNGRLFYVSFLSRYEMVVSFSERISRINIPCIEAPKGVPQVTGVLGKAPFCISSKLEFYAPLAERRRYFLFLRDLMYIFFLPAKCECSERA